MAEGGPKLNGRTVFDLTRGLEIPLSAAHGYLELLTRDDSLLSDPENRQQHLAVIRDHVRHIADLVAELTIRVDPAADRHRAPKQSPGASAGPAAIEESAVPAPVIRNRLDLANAQALRAIQDVRSIRATAKEEQKARELAEAQQLRAVEDFRTQYRRASTLAKQLDQAYLDTITALAKAVEARDQYTSRHVERVRADTLRIARRLGLSGEELRQLEFGAVLHDVGKIGIPDSILMKPGPLTASELEIMCRHPTIGRRVLEGIKFLEPALPAVESHHERWDGGGYPHGRVGDAIPLAGQIVAVADAYDAMISDRPYRSAMSREDSRAIIADARGTQFSPDVVDAFLAD